MKPAVEVSITSWKKNVVKPGQEYGRVLLMPGTGYNCDRPLLYWSAQALVEAGWRDDIIADSRHRNHPGGWIEVGVMQHRGQQHERQTVV